VDGVTRPVIECFPVVVPAGFVPTDSDGDGLDRNSSGTVCPGQDPARGYRPTWGGGMRAKRGTVDAPKWHAAVDIMGAEGLEIRAIADGVVPMTWKPGATRLDPGSGTSTKGGNYVVLEDGGVRWYFAHLRDAPLVRPGERVEAGQLLGYLGRTGNARRTVRRRDGSTYFYGCPHLHLAMTGLTRAVIASAKAEGIDVIGAKLDPVAYLRPLYEAGGWRAIEGRAA
jgi:murein DD-endopeptidase MepM/ murein hydrolase activator NlpD